GCGALRRSAAGDDLGLRRISHLPLLPQHRPARAALRVDGAEPSQPPAQDAGAVGAAAARALARVRPAQEAGAALARGARPDLLAAKALAFRLARARFGRRPGAAAALAASAGDGAPLPHRFRQRPAHLLRGADGWPRRRELEAGAPADPRP